MLFLSLSIKSVVLRRNITISEMICAGDYVFQAHGSDSPFPLLILMANRRPHCIKCDNLKTVLMKCWDGKPSLYTSTVPEGHNVIPIVDWQSAFPEIFGNKIMVSRSEFTFRIRQRRVETIAPHKKHLLYQQSLHRI